MTTAVRARPLAASQRDRGSATQPADVFVIFGITGDLAKVMTFHALHRPEQRGLLVFDRLSERLSYISGDFDDAETYKRVARQISLDMEFADQGGEGPAPSEVLLPAALIGNDRRFTRQDGVEECWRVMAPLLEHPPPVDSYKKGSWGPEAAEHVLDGYGPWHQPWVAL